MNSKLTAALAVILAAIMVVPCAAVCTSSAGETGVPDAVGSDYIDDGDNYSLIHVADNGNVSKMYTKTVTIDGQMYLKVTTNDFSVFCLHEEKEEMSETVIYVFAAILAIVCIGMLAFSIKKSGCS